MCAHSRHCALGTLLYSMLVHHFFPFLNCSIRGWRPLKKSSMPWKDEQTKNVFIYDTNNNGKKKNAQCAFMDALRTSGVCTPVHLMARRVNVHITMSTIVGAVGRQRDNGLPHLGGMLEKSEGTSSGYFGGARDWHPKPQAWTRWKGSAEIGNGSQSHHLIPEWFRTGTHHIPF